MKNAIIAAVALTAAIALGGVALAESNPTIDVKADCVGQFVVFTTKAAPKNETLAYTALSGPQAGTKFRVVNVPDEDGTVRFNADIIDLHTDNAYGVKFKVEYYDTASEKTIASKTLQTPNTCQGAKVVTVQGKGVAG